MSDFIYDMHSAYSAADVIISRAGAGTISELCIIGKPVIFVPSPNVSEDHQTKNAQALTSVDAALMVKDIDAQNQLVPEIINLLNDTIKCKTLSENIKKMELRDSADIIATEVFRIIDENLTS